MVVDIGEAQLAKKFDTMSRRSGTLAYMAPERAGGEEGSSESDMWYTFTSFSLFLRPVLFTKRAIMSKVVCSDNLRDGSFQETIHESSSVCDDDRERRS